MVRFLALDLARVAGAAWRDDSGCLNTRSFELGKPTTKLDNNLSRLYDEVESLLDEVRPTLVSIEDDTGRGAGARTLRAYHAIAILCAARRGIASRCDIGASKARLLALGNGGLDKEAAAKAARVFFGIEGSPDEVDAAILLIATERAVEAERYTAAVRTTKKRMRR